MKHLQQCYFRWLDPLKLNKRPTISAIVPTLDWKRWNIQCICQNNWSLFSVWGSMLSLCKEKQILQKSTKNCNLKLLMLEKLWWKLIFGIPLRFGKLTGKWEEERCLYYSKVHSITLPAFFLLQESTCMKRNKNLQIWLEEMLLKIYWRITLFWKIPFLPY